MISEHISDKEGVYSRTALRLGINNKPNKKQLNNMMLLADEIFEPLRTYTDIDDTYGHLTNAEMFSFIREHLDFDQMIWEFGDDDNPDWVHVSYVSPQENRNRCLKAYKHQGKTKYKVI
jgi:zinc D-Ala-D-Ala carboxypeptidase